MDYSAKFETEKHSFSGNSSQKSETKTFRIHDSPQVDFIPLDILTEFPNLNGLSVSGCNLPTVKASLFRVELNKIEYLDLQDNKIELVQGKAFEHLTKLKWVRLGLNYLQTLSYQLFRKNPYLIFIGLFGNQIDSIHPNFFDGLNSLKFIVFEKNLCVATKIGCETCSLSQADLRNHLQNCYNNCAKGTVCQTSYRIRELANSQNDDPLELGEILDKFYRNGKKDIEGVESELLKISNNLKQVKDSLTTKMETELKLSTKTLKEAIETNNQNMQESCSANENRVEKLQKSVEEIKTCTAVNQVEQTDESVQLFAVQQESLKMELIEAKCAKKEEALGTEMEALKQEFKGMKSMEDQLVIMKQKLNNFILEKLVNLENNLTTGG